MKVKFVRLSSKLIIDAKSQFLGMDLKNSVLSDSKNGNAGLGRSGKLVGNLLFRSEKVEFSSEV